jgi:hypothetical protein
MSAIITDQIRILNARNFISGVTTSSNSYYVFVGLPNSNEISEDWDASPPAPRDNFDEENSYWDTMIALKKVKESDVCQVIPKRVWESGNSYDYYRHDYSRSNLAAISSSTSLYSSSYYVMNSDYRVYICLQNGTDPDNPNGKPSLDEPTFVDLEPRSAGTSGDGYVWKYLYTIKPSDVVKFESTDFMPVPLNWETSIDHSPIRNNAIDGSIKTIIIKNRGVGVGDANRTYTKVPIKGDGSGAECTITINNDQQVESITVSNQGSGYTYGSVDLSSIPTASSQPIFDVIIPPKGGHGYDIYRELGAYHILVYSRIENDIENPDFITGNQISRIGIVENPKSFESSQTLTSDKVSSTYALRLTGAGYSTASFTPDSIITQTVGTGITAAGKVISYDSNTGVLKYWQDRTLAGFNTAGIGITNPTYGYDLIEFTSTPASGGSLVITGNTGGTLTINTSYSGISTVINSRTYYLGQSFSSGISNPEVKKYSGNIIYVDNRPAITRSINQKEDIKVILQF